MERKRLKFHSKLNQTVLLTKKSSRFFLIAFMYRGFLDIFIRKRNTEFLFSRNCWMVDCFSAAHRRRSRRSFDSFSSSLSTCWKSINQMPDSVLNELLISWALKIISKHECRCSCIRVICRDVTKREMLKVSKWKVNENSI